MAEKRNDLSGIANATAITTGNSGGVSGDAFDSISGTPTVYTSADITDASDRGARADLASDTSEYFGWAVPSATAGFARFYFRAGTINKGYTYRMLRLYAANGTTIRGEVRMSDAGSQLQFTDETGGHITRYESLAANTIYRVEIDWTSGSPEMRVYAGESTTPLTVNAVDHTKTFSEVSYVRFGAFTSLAQTVSNVELACPAWSDTTWLGPEPSGVAGVANFSLSTTYTANSDTFDEATYEVDATGSTGTVTLVQQSGTTAAPSESPTGVFTITDPGGADNLEYLLTAAGTGSQADADRTVTIRRGTAAAPAIRHLVSGGDPTVDADWV